MGSVVPSLPERTLLPSWTSGVGGVAAWGVRKPWRKRACPAASRGFVGRRFRCRARRERGMFRQASSQAASCLQGRRAPSPIRGNAQSFSCPQAGDCPHAVKADRAFPVSWGERRAFGRAGSVPGGAFRPQGRGGTGRRAGGNACASRPQGGHGGSPVWPWTVSESALSVRRGGGVPIPTSCITSPSARFSSSGASSSLQNARGPHCRLRRASLGSGAGAVRPSQPGKTDFLSRAPWTSPPGRTDLLSRAIWPCRPGGSFSQSVLISGGPRRPGGGRAGRVPTGAFLPRRDEESPRKRRGLFPC